MNISKKVLLARDDVKENDALDNQIKKFHMIFKTKKRECISQTEQFFIFSSLQRIIKHNKFF